MIKIFLACSFLFVDTGSHPVSLAALGLVITLLLLSVLGCWESSHDTLTWVLNCRACTDVKAEVGHERGDLLKLSLHLPQHVLCLLMGNDQGTGTCQLWERERKKEFQRKGLSWIKTFTDRFYEHWQADGQNDKQRF